jgi:putative transcriptional regulator
MFSDDCLPPSPRRAAAAVRAHTHAVQRLVVSLQGHLLISAPELGDMFEQSVVLMVRHNTEGAFGLILNRPSETKVEEIWSKISGMECRTTELLYVGGPVEGPLMVIHNDEAAMEMEILPGVYFSANRDKLEKLARQPDAAVRYFVGYAGWSAGQLEAEIKRGSWQAMPARPDLIFTDGDRLWERARREIADHVLRARLGIKHSPPDVRMN